MRRVLVIQDVNGKNLLPAKEYGDLCVMLSGHENPQVAFSKLKEQLSEMQRDDFLLLIGSPVNIAMAGFLALFLYGSVNFLVWDRKNYKYNIERITNEECNDGTRNIG